MKTIFLLLLLFITKVYSVSPFDCRRLNNCENGASCDATGTCVCPTGFSGDTCRLIDGTTCPTDPSPCQNGGTCFDNTGAAQCACVDGYLGDNCEIMAVDVTCNGDSIVFDLNFPEANFEGYVELQDAANPIPAPCAFTSTTANGIETPALTILLGEVTNDATSVCGNDQVTITTGAIGTSYNRLIRVQYMSNMVTVVDEIVNVTCTHQEGDITLSTDTSSIAFDTADLPTDDTEKIYSPVQLDMLKEDGTVYDPINDPPLNVGDVFYLHAYITDTQVFKEVKFESCIANDTKEVGAKTFTMFDGGCPTKSGKKTIETQYDEAKIDATTSASFPGKKTKLTAFKFLDEDLIGLMCGVKLCKDGDATCAAPTAADCEALINPAATTDNSGTATTAVDNTGNTVNGDTTGAANNDATNTNADGTADPTTAPPVDTGLRRRRAADDESSQTLSKVFAVRGPSDFSSSSNTGEMESTTVEGCLEQTEIMAVLIILICIVCILFIACFVLAFCLIRRKQQKHIQDSTYYRNERFQIPRAHVNEAYREM